MASGSQGLRTGIQVVLGLAIVALAYWLYVSITAPYEEIERQERITEQTRERMKLVSQALILHERREDRFPSTLDSLLIWLRQDSLAMAQSDSLFGAGALDSLIYSPRTNQRFVYALNDTGRVDIYLLKDPDSNDQIGAEEPDVTLLNAASWE